MLKEVVNVCELRYEPNINGKKVRQFFLEHGQNRIEVRKIEGNGGSAEFIKIVTPGRSGKLSGGLSPTFGIIGRSAVTATGKE